MQLQEVEWGGMHCTDLADQGQMAGLMNPVM
jgi:hypothetical protein